MYRASRKEEVNQKEIESLAETAGYSVVGVLKQIRKPDPKYQIGEGKVKELAELVKETSVERVIFDNDLKPVQAYNLAKATGVEVIDRFQLILEIFSRRASTLEAKLQIKLAQLTRELSRAKEKVRLARMAEQPGFSGLGKYEVDIYYETVRRQVHRIKRVLKKVRKRRSLHRERRVELGYHLISLAGYTNSGKSTLFNAFTGGEAPIDSQLFTTLSTKTRLIDLLGRKVLLTDTVGFIDRLPLELINAFHSTLEETTFSDLILLVLDISDPLEEVERKISTCMETFEKINAKGIPIVTALNKIDLTEESEIKYKTERMEIPNPVPVSALKRINLESLEEKIVEFLPKPSRFQLNLEETDEALSLVSNIFDRTRVLDFKMEEGTISISFEAPSWLGNRIRSLVEDLGGTLRRSRGGEIYA